tara:strand:- start:749 stop:1495 length:747 start_codon:yes stop_codon:yes gene_type:complete
MKNTFFFFYFLLFVCCNNSQKNNSIQILDFPSWSDSLRFINCDEIIAKTPLSFNFKIYEDSIIDLNQLDNRLNLSFKFNWHYEDYFDIGVNSIDFLLEDGSSNNIKFGGTEAFLDKDSQSNRFGEIVRDDITMIDVNMDSYLDIRIRTFCGKSCEYEYWIYNESTNNFDFSSSFAYTKPYCIDCKRQILYSYGGGDAFSFKKIAYKIHGNKLSQLQSSYYDSWSKDYDLQQYFDSAGNLIFSDTTLKQ